MVMWLGLNGVFCITCCTILLIKLMCCFLVPICGVPGSVHDSRWRRYEVKLSGYNGVVIL